ncbi:response regulator [Sphingomonas sp. G-3-2-10]|jgi:two-component system OmpR family response regulator|uniref:response regulator n=1 Tax=Sphingomonas sp. G-3-2-10 TaxID=2728838 RepID=UPI00146B4DA3|nr:response regulator [Sphingomonas sp. G-3-2-10]NML06607.1 response regulator [Sphingomonas sp. G-3-2-10]
MLHQTPTTAAAAATLLVVDDDRDIRQLLADSLGARGYRVETAASARDMDQILARIPVDLIILDVMMPGEDGLSACRRIARDDGPEIVFLSALGEEHDRILGLEVGAGHYLTKPCSPREILATVRAALRRRGAGTVSDGHQYVFDGWRIDLASHELFDPQGVLVGLTDGEFAVLRVFIERPRRVLSREALLSAARGPDSDAYDRAIDVQVSRLRRKLRAGADEIIRTVRNEGYLFVPRVSRA